MNKRIKSICIPVFSLLFVFVGFYIAWKLYVDDARTKEYISQHTGESSWDNENGEVFELEFGEVLTQTFVNNISSTKLEFILPNDDVTDEQLEVILINNTNDYVVYSEKVDSVDKLITVVIQDEIKEECEYSLILKNHSKDKNIDLSVTKDDKYQNGKLFVDNTEIERDLVFTVYSREEIYRTWLYIGIIISVLVSCLVWLWIRKEYTVVYKWKYSLIIISIMYFILFPPLTIPDETAHVETAYRFSNQLLGYGFESGKDQMYIRTADLDLYQLNRENSCSNHIYIRRNWEMFSKDNTIISVETRAASKSVLLYLPCALGITIGRILNLGCFPLLYIGKLCNLIFYLCCIFKAVKIVPVAKKALMIMTLLPMVIQQSVSFSYDVIIMGVSFLFFAICMQLAFGEKRTFYNVKEILLLLYCISTLIVAKGHVYIFIIALLLLTVKKDKFLKKKQLFGIMVFGVILFTLGLFLIIGRYGGALFEIKQMTDFEGMRYSLGYILVHPLVFTKSVLQTIMEKLSFYIVTLIGQSLGWLNIPVHEMITNGYILVLTLAVLEKEEGTLGIKVSHKILMGSICVLVCASIFAGLATTNYIGSMIEGVQGRYFLPIFPLLFVICKNNSIVCKIENESLLIKGEILLQMMTLLYVVKFIFCGL